MEKMFATKTNYETYNHDIYSPVREQIPARCFCKYKAVKLLKTISNQNYTDPSGLSGWGYSSCWNGSFHEASFSPTLYAWSKGKKKFQRTNKMMQQALAWYKEQSAQDTSIAQFNTRQKVRPGD